MAEADTFTISVAGGEDAPRALTLRRPTHGELDLGLLERLVQVIVGYQNRIVGLEAAPEPGAAVKIANLLGLCNEAIGEVRDRVRRFLARTAGTETLAWFDGGGEVEVARRASEIAVALILTLAPPTRLPK